MSVVWPQSVVKPMYKSKLFSHRFLLCISIGIYDEIKESETKHWIAMYWENQTNGFLFIGIASNLCHGVCVLDRLHHSINESNWTQIHLNLSTTVYLDSTKIQYNQTTKRCTHRHCMYKMLNRAWFTSKSFAVRIVVCFVYKMFVCDHHTVYAT